jgi:hypothetical protein
MSGTDVDSDSGYVDGVFDESEFSIVCFVHDSDIITLLLTLKARADNGLIISDISACSDQFTGSTGFSDSRSGFHVSTELLVLQSASFGYYSKFFMVALSPPDSSDF